MTPLDANPSNLLPEQAWILRIFDPEKGASFWIRFGTLKSKNGFRHQAEVHAMVSTGSESPPQIFHQRWEGKNLKVLGPEALSVGACVLRPESSNGDISTKSETFSWNLNFSKEDSAPSPWRGCLSGRTRALFDFSILQGRFLVRGTFSVNGQVFALSPGSIGKIEFRSGTEHLMGFTSLGAPRFEAEGPARTLELEGTVFYPRLGPIRLPRLCGFYIRYGDKSFWLNTPWNWLRTRIESLPEGLRFSVEVGDLIFKGEWETPVKSFRDFVFEDVSQSVLYSSVSFGARATVQVYRDGKLEASYQTRREAFFERVRRHPPSAFLGKKNGAKGQAPSARS